MLALNYQDPQHVQDMLYLLNKYALEHMSSATVLNRTVRNNLTAEVAKPPHAFSVICYVDNTPAGLVNYIEAFSTFKCTPLINIHDVVCTKFRGLSQKMSPHVEKIAIQKGCCKITLEVLDGNHIAKNAHIKFSFAGYEYDPKMGNALFWEIPL